MSQPLICLNENSLKRLFVNVSSIPIRMHCVSVKRHKLSVAMAMARTTCAFSFQSGSTGIVNSNGVYRSPVGNR